MILSLIVFVPLVVLAIPVVAVTMAFVALIARMIFQQRARERVMLDRIAAVQRGVDPSQLPTV